MSNVKDMEQLLSSAGGLDAQTIATLKNNPVAEDLFGKLSEKDKQKLMATLSDREATERLLSSPQAKMIMEFLKRGKQ